MEEVKRFLKSIDITYSDEYKDITVDKVVYNRETKVYSVYLRNPFVLDYDVILNLFNHAKKGINGVDKCFIELIYDNITNEDEVKFFNIILNNIIFEHPSAMSLEKCLKEIKDNVIYLEVASESEKFAISEYEKRIISDLKNLGIGDYSININGFI